MSSIRLLNTGEWNKPPVLTAARRLLIEGLAKHFPKTTLGNMASFVNGTSYDTGKLSGDGTPIIRISNITNPESGYLRTDQEFDTRFLADRGDLLVSWSASFKSIIWPRERGIVNQHIFRVTEEPGYHRGFIRHTIEAVFDDLQENVVGIGMKHLRRRDFLEHTVPNPDAQTQELISNYLDWLEDRNGEPEPPLPATLSEQQRIVGRLEHLASKIEEARGLREKSVKEANAVLAIATKMAFREIEETRASLSDLIGKQGLKNGLSLKSLSELSEIQCLKLSALRDGYVALNDAKPVPVDAERAKPYLVKQNDVFIVRGNGSKELVGRAGSVQEHSKGIIFPDLFIRVSLDVGVVVPRFFVAWWNSPDMRQAIEQAAKTTSGIWKVNQQFILSSSMPLPDLNEQQRIVDYLDDIQAHADSLKQLQAQTRAELDALLPSILDKAFRGEL